MEAFYIIVLSVAVIFLILVLTIIGIMMSAKNNKEVFPPTKNTCPDYWTSVDNGGDPKVNKCKINPSNIGSFTRGTDQTYNIPTDTPGYNAADGTINFGDSKWGTKYQRTSQCALNFWTNTNKISWDGISNFNGC